MHAVRGLIWEQWRQSRYWIVGSSAFLLMLTGGVALNRAWIADHFHGHFELENLAWVIGFTAIGLLFVNQRLREVTLNFPRRQFALPCRTVPLVASHLLYKSGIAVLLGALIALYHWVLLEQDGPSVLPVVLFLALVAATQAVVMLAAILGPWRAVGAGVATGAGALFFFYALEEQLHLSEGDAAVATALGLTVFGWAGALACGPAARHGRRGERRERSGLPGFSLGGNTVSLRLAQPVVIRWDFSAPLWAQCWYEWRRVLVWVPRIVLPSVAVLSLNLLRGGNANGITLPLLFATCSATAFACSYFLLRVSPSEGRFLFAQPESERALADGKLLSALATAVLTTAMTAVIALLAAALATLFNEERMADSILQALPAIAVAQAALLWVTLTSAPVYLAGFIVWIALVIAVAAPVAGLAEWTEHFMIVGAIYAAVLAGLLFAALRWLRAKKVPIPWEAGLVALAGLYEIGTRILVVDFVFDPDLFEISTFDGRIGFLCPLFLLLGGLLFARRIGLISRRRLVAVVAAHLVVCALFIGLIASGARLSLLTEADTVFWWVAACFAPVVWVPLAVRLQRYR